MTNASANETGATKLTQGTFDRLTAERVTSRAVALGAAAPLNAGLRPRRDSDRIAHRSHSNPAPCGRHIGGLGRTEFPILFL